MLLKSTSALLAGMLLLCNVSSAQEEMSEPKTKLFDHRIGVQVNELVRQVFNFSNTSSAINNPYLLMYSLNFSKSGWGIRMGVGPRFSSFKDDDGITQEENDINAIDARIGLEKAFKLSDRWSAGAGADFVYGNDVSYSKTFVRSFDSTSTDVVSTTNYSGYGGMAWIRYHITPKVHIGTEASFYYRTGDYKQEVSITRKTNTFNGQSIFKTTVTDVDNKLKEAKFNLPMVFYLVVMF